MEKGFCVYAGARRIEPMKEIEARGGNIVALDITNEESMCACVENILKKEGRIDILINNAGYGSCGAVEDIPMEEVKRQYEVNVFGLGRMIQLVLPAMRKHNYGKIINISSMGGRFTSPFGGWYHSTKYAVESISDALRMELRKYNIEVVLIEPGMIQTDWGVIAAQNIRETAKNSAYCEDADLAAQYYEKRYGKGKQVLTNPDNVAKLVGRIVTKRKNKARYLVGKFSHTFVFFKTILPDSLFQKITILSMGMN
ncbi:MAG: SDR family NAD(P)-dependent oxidoreductase [Lachnospiraceae bacterium]|nr:SDR family NAD(P)-dependent oxidoreductase [Lachnospiraceae bacterium]